MLDIQTETDVASILNSYAARQPDNERFRLWEVAGTAHADAHLVGAVRSTSTAACRSTTVRCTSSPKARCALTTWLTTGKAPPIAPRIDVIARRDTAGPSRRRRHRARRHPHAAGRRARRGAVGRAGPEPVDDLPAARFDEAVLRRAARAALSVTRRVPPALRRRRRRDDQGRLRAPRRSRRPARVRRTIPHTQKNNGRDRRSLADASRRASESLDRADDGFIEIKPWGVRTCSQCRLASRKAVRRAPEAQAQFISAR